MLIFVFAFDVGRGICGLKFNKHEFAVDVAVYSTSLHPCVQAFTHTTSHTLDSMPNYTSWDKNYGRQRVEEMFVHQPTDQPTD